MAAPGNVPGYVVLPLSLMDRANQATLRMSINGKPTMLMLDTGANVTILDQKFYKGAVSASNNVKRDDLPIELQKKLNANGQRAEIGYIDSLKAGPADFGKNMVLITDLAGNFGTYNNYHMTGSISGLLGEDFLHKHGAIIDWARKGVYLNTDPSKRMKVGPGLVAAGWIAVPMAQANTRHFTVQATVSGKPVRLIVDTGAQFTTFAPGVVPLTMHYNRDTGSSMVRIASNAGTSRMVGSDATMFPAEVEHWKIGNYEIASSLVAVHHFPPGLLAQQSAGEGPVLGLLGSEVLSKNHAIIDITGSTLYLKSH